MTQAEELKDSLLNGSDGEEQIAAPVQPTMFAKRQSQGTKFVYNEEVN